MGYDRIIVDIGNKYTKISFMSLDCRPKIKKATFIKSPSLEYDMRDAIFINDLESALKSMKVSRKKVIFAFNSGYSNVIMREKDISVEGISRKEMECGITNELMATAKDGLDLFYTSTSAFTESFDKVRIMYSLIKKDIIDTLFKLCKRNKLILDEVTIRDVSVYKLADFLIRGGKITDIKEDDTVLLVHLGDRNSKIVTFTSNKVLDRYSLDHNFDKLEKTTSMILRNVPKQTVAVGETLSFGNFNTTEEVEEVKPVASKETKLMLAKLDYEVIKDSSDYQSTINSYVASVYTLFKPKDINEKRVPMKKVILTGVMSKAINLQSTFEDTFRCSCEIIDLNELMDTKECVVIPNCEGVELDYQMFIPSLCYGL